VTDIWLHGAVCRQRAELCPIFGYMELCVDRELNCDRYLVTWSCMWTESSTVTDIWLHGAVCRQRAEMWPIFDYVKLCVDRELNCGRYLVTWSCM